MRFCSAIGFTAPTAARNSAVSSGAILSLSFTGDFFTMPHVRDVSKIYLNFAQRSEILVRIQCRHTARRRAGDSLAINLVLHIARRKHAGTAGRRGIAMRAALRLDVTVDHLQLPGENVGIGLVADR